MSNLSGQLEDLLEHPANAFVLVGGGRTLSDALAVLSRRSGSLGWYLVVKMGDGHFKAARFSEIRHWEKEQSNPGAILRPLADLDGPFQPVEILNDDTPLEAVEQAVLQSAGGLVLVTWTGSDVVCGIVSRASFLGTEFTPSEPEKTFTSEVQKTRTEIVLPAGAWGHLRNWANKYKIKVIWGLITFTIMTLIPLFLTYRNNILPALFPSYFLPSMTGEWNIAVTSFDLSGASGISSGDAAEISEVFFNSFKAEMDTLGSSSSLAVQYLGPDTLGKIGGSNAEERAQNAAELAHKVNADIVIYGAITQTGEGLTLQPEFFVDTRNLQEAAEMVGQHSLGSGIAIVAGAEDLPTQRALNLELSRRAEVFSLITRGLSDYFTHNYTDALDLFTQANQERYWDYPDGREVVYLFQGNAAGRANDLEQAKVAYLKALEVDADYARAYVGLGGVAYSEALLKVTSDQFTPDLDKFKLALDFYDQALTAKNASPTADIPAKVAFGRGQVYLMEWFAGQDTLALAQRSFMEVLGFYDGGNNPRLQEMASETHARLGIIARQQNDLTVAVSEYTIARDLATNPSRRGLYNITLGDLHTRQGSKAEGQAAYETAVKEFQSALTITSDVTTRVSLYKQMAQAYLALENPEEAARIIEDALTALPENDRQREELQELLVTINQR